MFHRGIRPRTRWRSPHLRKRSVPSESHLTPQVFRALGGGRTKYVPMIQFAVLSLRWKDSKIKPHVKTIHTYTYVYIYTHKCTIWFIRFIWFHLTKPTFGSSKHVQYTSYRVLLAAPMRTGGIISPCFKSACCFGEIHFVAGDLPISLDKTHQNTMKNQWLSIRCSKSWLKIHSFLSVNSEKPSLQPYLDSSHCCWDRGLKPLKCLCPGGSYFANARIDAAKAVKSAVKMVTFQTLASVLILSGKLT